MNRNELLNYSFSDGTVKAIVLDEDKVRVRFELWNAEEITFDFKNCWKIVNWNSINTEIEDVLIVESSKSIEEVKKKIINTGGSEEEANRIYEVVFIDSWYEKEVLSIIVEDFNIIK